MGEAALQAGNSEAIIRKHYLDLKTPAEAEDYFSIMPASIGTFPVPNAPSAVDATVSTFKIEQRRTRAA